MQKFLVVIIFVSFVFSAVCQDSAYAKTIISELSSPEFHGRGYVKNGDKKAAKFIVSQLKKLGVQPLGDKYEQEFSFPMNVMDGAMNLLLDNKDLLPVRHFVPAPDCPTVKGTFPLVYLPAAADTNDALYDSLLKTDFGNVFIVTAFSKRKITRVNPFKSYGMIVPVKNIMWWAAGANEPAIKPVIHLVDTLLKGKPANVTIEIESHLKKQHKTQNILAFVPGTVQPDTFIVFSAHYDHLGHLGAKTYFPGAHDNASGTAMVLSLAKQFKTTDKKPYYSIAFMFFAAEEVGLFGSGYYTENPVFPLRNIKTLINLDMVGSGSEGISVVNGKKNPQITTVIDSINRTNHYFTDIRIGDEGCNSDHCFFARKNVPAVFIFTRGKECPYYHVLDDNYDNTPLTKFNSLEQLLMDLAE